MVILDISETWNNDHNPTFIESYLEDDNGEIRVSGNAPYEIKVMVTAWLLDMQMHWELPRILEMSIDET